MAALVPLLAATLGGCAAPSGSAVTTTAQDSAGVLIVTIDGSPGDLPEWTLSDDPVMRIEEGGPGGAPPFGLITEAAWVADGGIAVLDLQTRELHIFDSGGARLHSFGGPGDGPGEFRSPFSLSVPHEDSLAIYDLQHARLSLFHVRSGFARSVPLLTRADGEPPIRAWAAEGGDVVVYSVTSDPTGGSSGPYPRRWDHSAMLSLHHSSGEQSGGEQSDGERPGGERTAETYTFPGTYSAQVETGGDVRLPFANEPVIAARGGRIVFGGGQTFHLTELDRSFIRTRELRWPAMSERLTPDEVEAVRSEIRSGLSRMPPAVAAMLEEAMLSPYLLPPERPAVGGLLVGRDGRTWVARFRPRYLGPPREWYVLDGEGMPMGRIVLPERARLMDASADQLLLVWSDSLDVESVAVHDLTPAN